MMLNNPKVNAKLYEVNLNKQMNQTQRKMLDYIKRKHVPRLRFTKMNS
jgi:hypothetical protein